MSIRHTEAAAESFTAAELAAGILASRTSGEPLCSVEIDELVSTIHASLRGSVRDALQVYAALIFPSVTTPSHTTEGEPAADSVAFEPVKEELPQPAGDLVGVSA